MGAFGLLSRRQAAHCGELHSSSVEYVGYLVAHSTLALAAIGQITRVKYVIVEWAPSTSRHLSSRVGCAVATEFAFEILLEVATPSTSITLSASAGERMRDRGRGVNFKRISLARL